MGLDLQSDEQDGREVAAAIRHGADAGGARIAARTDGRRAAMWLAIADDQGRLAAWWLDRWLQQAGR